MTLAQLRYALAVDRHRSFREAARQCHVSQPALSMQIKRLEEILGVRLFDRSRAPVVPTAEGERVLAQARATTREAERMEQVVAEASGELSGSYRLAVIPTLAPSLLPRLLPAFVSAHPRVELVVEELQTDVMVERLLGDGVDGGLAATPLSVPGLRERRVCHEPFHVYLPPRHPLRERDTVRQSELADAPVWIMAEGHCFRDQVLHLCRADRAVGAVRFAGGSFETLVRLVDAGLGVTVLPELVVLDLPAARRRRVRPFTGPVPAREIGFVHAREDLRRGIADALFDALSAALPEALRAVAGARVLPPTAPG